MASQPQKSESTAAKKDGPAVAHLNAIIPTIRDGQTVFTNRKGTP